jgi:hypothetical protein
MRSNRRTDEDLTKQQRAAIDAVARRFFGNVETGGSFRRLHQRRQKQVAVCLIKLSPRVGILAIASWVE